MKQEFANSKNRRIPVLRVPAQVTFRGIRRRGRKRLSGSRSRDGAGLSGDRTVPKQGEVREWN